MPFEFDTNWSSRTALNRFLNSPIIIYWSTIKQRLLGEEIPGELPIYKEEEINIILSLICRLSLPQSRFKRYYSCIYASNISNSGITSRIWLPKLAAIILAWPAYKIVKFQGLNARPSESNTAKGAGKSNNMEVKCKTL